MSCRLHGNTSLPGVRLRSSSNTIMKIVFAILLVMMVSAGGSARLYAAQERGTSDQQADCMPNVFRLCPSQIPDEASILACLQSKVALLSPACHRVIEPGRQTRP